MRSISRQFVRNFSACLLALVFAVPVSLFAETAHVVSPSDLQQQAVSSSQARQQNVEKVRDFLSTPLATKAMQDAKIDSRQVKDAVASLDDQELSQLAARADKAQKDFAAGYLSTRDIALIILGVVLIIVIIVIAH
jgi:acyl-CoA synthetase (AMP-forming)/AMP-acid ligase II